MSEIVKGLGQVFVDLAGPAAKEIGEMIRDELRPYRTVRHAKLIEKTVNMPKKANIRPERVSPKILLSVFDSAGIEGDEDMHTRWACLLANAANSPPSVLPYFPDILRQLTPLDAQFLDLLYQATRRKSLETFMGDPPICFIEIGERLDLLGHFESLHDRKEFPVSMENLTRLGLIFTISTTAEEPLEIRGAPKQKMDHFLTMTAVRFVGACHLPIKLAGK